MSTQDIVRIGIIGAGNIGTVHMNHFGKLPGVEIAALTDVFFAACRDESQGARH